MKPPGDPEKESYDVTSMLPVASPKAVRRYAGRLINRNRKPFIRVVWQHGIGAVAGLAGPFILGRLVEDLTHKTSMGMLNTAALWFLAALVVQTIFTRLSRQGASVLGETILADLREDFLIRSVALPPGVLERAGTGDLVSRMTTDIDRLTRSVRDALPQIAIALVSAVLVFVALVINSWPMALLMLCASPLLLIGCRWYFRRAPQAYRAEAAKYAAVNVSLAETVDAGPTVEAYRLGPARVAQADTRLRTWLGWERYTLALRSLLFPSIDFTYVFSLILGIVGGGFLVLNGWISLGQFTTGVLYMQLLINPIDLIIMWYDELQVGQASLARLVGVHEMIDPEHDESAHPVGADLNADGIDFGYREGVDVLHNVTLHVQPGSRVALVGPSGAGKSTLGRLLAGIYAPRQGEITLGGAALPDMPPERVREHVALVNQEHHVFVGSLRDNLRLADPSAGDGRLWEALGAVDAEGWARLLPDGLDTEVGSGGAALTPAQAQQIGLARLVLADPHTLVLDEATSLLDPRAARHLERSLSAVLDGRTVISIAHRLHTAHDADVIAVVDDGRISEYGSHDELVKAGGTYASLWESWRDD